MMVVMVPPPGCSCGPSYACSGAPARFSGGSPLPGSDRNRRGAALLGAAELLAQALLPLAQRPPALFVGFGLAGGEHVGGLAHGFDRQGDDVDGGAGDTAGEREAQSGEEQDTHGAYLH
jgi:hypothetical protein